MPDGARHPGRMFPVGQDRLLGGSGRSGAALAMDNQRRNLCNASCQLPRTTSRWLHHNRRRHRVVGLGRPFSYPIFAITRPLGRLVSVLGRPSPSRGARSMCNARSVIYSCVDPTHRRQDLPVNVGSARAGASSGHMRILRFAAASSDLAPLRPCTAQMTTSRRHGCHPRRTCHSDRCARCTADSGRGLAPAAILRRCSWPSDPPGVSDTREGCLPGDRRAITLATRLGSTGQDHHLLPAALPVRQAQ